MLFTNPRTYSNISNTQPSSKMFMVMPIMNSPPPHRPLVKPSVANATSVRELTDSTTHTPKHKPMKWGEPIWFLFHTLAEKVKESRFQAIRVDLLNIIFSICNNLPCPDCAKHATMYMNNINFNNIQTKDQLKNMLFVFHNTVNSNKHFPLFPREQLDDKYSKANTVLIIQNFLKHFQDKHTSIRMIANDFHRSNMTVKLNQWFINNMASFDM